MAQPYLAEMPQICGVSGTPAVQNQFDVNAAVRARAGVYIHRVKRLKGIPFFPPCYHFSFPVNTFPATAL